MFTMNSYEHKYLTDLLFNKKKRKITTIIRIRIKYSLSIFFIFEAS